MHRSMDEGSFTLASLLLLLSTTVEPLLSGEDGDKDDDEDEEDIKCPRGCSSSPFSLRRFVGLVTSLLLLTAASAVQLLVRAAAAGDEGAAMSSFLKQRVAELLDFHSRHCV